MKTIVCERPLHLAVHERPIPLRGPGEVLVRIRRVGICGTDYHIFGGNQPYLSYPRVMGHELAATVEEADADADLAPGDVVTILPYLACDECIACRRGKPNCCTHLQVLGVHRDGGMAEYLPYRARPSFQCRTCRWTKLRWWSSWRSAPMRSAAPA